MDSNRPGASDSPSGRKKGSAPAESKPPQANPPSESQAPSAAMTVPEEALQPFHLSRLFTQAGTDALDAIRYERRSCFIRNTDGSVVFALEDAEVPEDWSQLASDILISKYFRKAGVPGTGHETSIRQVVQPHRPHPPRGGRAPRAATSPTRRRPTPSRRSSATCSSPRTGPSTPPSGSTSASGTSTASKGRAAPTSGTPPPTPSRRRPTPTSTPSARPASSRAWATT